MGNAHVIRILEQDESVGVCPDGQVILHMYTVGTDESSSAEKDLWPALEYLTETGGTETVWAMFYRQTIRSAGGKLLSKAESDGASSHSVEHTESTKGAPGGRLVVCDQPGPGISIEEAVVLVLPRSCSSPSLIQVPINYHTYAFCFRARGYSRSCFLSMKCSRYSRN